MPGMRLRHALITGAGNGLGRHLALHLAASGWHIGVADVNRNEGEVTCRLVREAGGSAEFLALDVRDEAQWIVLHDDLRHRWPQLDLLVNNAGVSASGEVGQTSIENWDWVLSINLRGVVLGCHTMVAWLKANPERAYIMNVASAAALLCAPGMAAYNVAKAGVVALSHSLFIELRSHDVGVTAVCPWFVRTSLLSSGRFATDSQRDFAEKAMAKARVSPEAFAKIALEGTFRGKLMVVPGRRPRLAVALKRLFPQTFMTLLHRYISRLPSVPLAPDAAPRLKELPGGPGINPPSPKTETALS